MSITIPDAVKNIEEWAFYDCSPDLAILASNDSFAMLYAKENSIKVTYHYWKDGVDVLSKTPERQPASKAREYVINILPEQ